MPTINMTAQWVDRVKPGRAFRLEFFDSKAKGLGLRVSPSGKKTWVVMYRVKGDPKKRRFTLAPYPHLSLADAREQARHVVLDAARGADPALQKQEEIRAPTFDALAGQYIERHAKKAKRSWREDQRMLNRDVLPVWGCRKAHNIKRRDVIALLDEIADRAPIQANRTLALVRKIFNWAISRDIVETNPCTQLKAPAKERQRDRVLNEDEIRALWIALDRYGRNGIPKSRF